MNIGILGTGSIARTMAAEFAKVPAFRCEAVCSRQRPPARRWHSSLASRRSTPTMPPCWPTRTLSWSISPPPTACTMRRPRRRFWPERTSSARSPSSLPWRRLTSSSRWRKRSTSSSSRPSPRPTTNYALAKQYLDDIGSLRIVSCTFCQYSSRYDALLSGQVPPVFDPACCGGALMDLNLYNVHFVVGLFGEPVLVSYHRTSTGTASTPAASSCWNTPTSSASVPAQRTAPRRAASSSSATRAASSSSRAAATARSSASSVPDRRIFAASTVNRRGSTRWRRSP